MKAALRFAVGVALTVFMSGLGACDALGNPPRIQRTPSTITDLGPVRLVTRTETVPAARAKELLGRIEGRPHHADRVDRAFVTLVVVDVAPRGAILPRRVILDTELGSALGAARHRWAAPGAARPLVAVFATDAAPTAARTLAAR
jgi:hypothetical protein